MEFSNLLKANKYDFIEIKYMFELLFKKLFGKINSTHTKTNTQELSLRINRK